MQKDGWEFLLCIDSEPSITNQEKSGGVIYTGSIGNITIFTLFVGKESHVGEFYDGINAAVLTAKMIYDIEGDPNTADSYDGRHFSPASCLKFKDFTAGYSVTLPARSAVIINLLTAKKSVTEILAYFTQKAKESGEAALRKHYGLETIKVITFSELKNMVTGFEGEISLETTAKEDADIELVNRLITDAGLSGPLAVVGFIPPYCGAKLNEKKTLSEIKAAEAAEDVAAYAEKLTGSRLAVEAVYEGISDLSEMGGVPEDIEVLKDNMAGYGKMITYPFEEMKSLAIPVINLGPIGKDAHKPTERVFIPYLTQTLPLLLKRLIENYNTF
jgi:arginine utilization protein RocB